MADTSTNYLVSQQRLRWQISAQRTAIEQNRLAILEMYERRQQHLANISASEEAIKRIEADLTALEQAHGFLTDEDIAEMSAEV